MHQRNQTLDFLRGLGIILMITTHAQAYYLKDKLASFLWDFSHFVVAIFIFVSAYLFFKKNSFKHNWVTYIKKRIIRLLLPYYIFLLLMLATIAIFEPKNLSLTFIWQNLILDGGVDINWLTRLFIYFVFLNPFLLFLTTKRRWLKIYTVFSLLSSIIFLFYYPHSHYRLIMWLPWSLIALFALYFINNHHRPYFFPLNFGVSLLIFLNLRFWLESNHHTLILQENKYPPNLYYLSYGTTIILLLYYSFNKITLPDRLKKILNFFSRYSYSIFFVHWWLIYVVSKLFSYWNWQWWQFTIVVLCGSSLLQISLNKLSLLFRKNFFKEEENIRRTA
jgi:peptidoglycan/LPS O-acetylase OafA/YrhL